MDVKFRNESQADRLLKMIRNVTVKDDDFEKKMLISKICVELITTKNITVQKYVYKDFYDIFLKVCDSIIPWLMIYDVFKVKDLDTINYNAKVIKLVTPKFLQLLEEKCKELKKYNDEHKHKNIYKEKIIHKRLINLPEYIIGRILIKKNWLIDSSIV